MGLRATVYQQIEEAPRSEWMQLAPDDVDLAMDPRLLSTFQSTMHDQCRCWFVVIRDGQEQAIASASLCLFRIDALETTGAVTRLVTRKIRRLFPGYMRFNVLFCGLPAPSADNHLRIAPGADRAAVLQTLHEVMCKLAREQRARMIVLKEFERSRRKDFRALEGLGYIHGELPSARRLELTFNSFDDYCAALRATYRKQVKESLRKFHRAGCTCEHLRGKQIAPVYTDQLHQLYLNVLGRAKYRLETFDPEFFRQLALEFGDDAAMTIVRQGGEVLGWAFSLTAGGECHNLYIGLDYARNADADVYFNLHFLDLDRAFRGGCTRVHLGQTSDDFKSRLGCVAEPLSFYVRAANPIMHMMLRKFARWVFPPVKQPTLLNVFRSADASLPQTKKIKV
jgi:predicted N-acyltransferase